MFFPDIDPRLAKWPFMENPNSTYLIVFLYLLFIKVIGPAYMKNRQPYSLRTSMIFYNFAMVIYSAWMCYKVGKYGWFGKYSWICEPLDQSTDEGSMEVVRACWHFSTSKIIELLDTVFFVLRKKDSHISFLHVLHHALVPISARYAVSRGPGGFNTLFPLVNTFIHTWMYLYYGLAALGPAVQKYLWWKKYLTLLQMIQFCIVIVFMLSYTFLPGCDANPALIIVSLGQAVLFLLLFAAFYSSSYRRKTPETKTVTTLTADAILLQANKNGTEPRFRFPH